MQPTPPLPTQERHLHIRLVREVRMCLPSLLATLAAGLLASLAGIGGAWSLSQAVASIFLHEKTINDIRGLFVGLLILIAVRGIFTWVSDGIAGKLAIQIKTSLRERLFAHILDLGPAYTQRNQTGSLVNLITDGIEALDAYYSQYLPRAVFAVMIPLAILICVTPVDPLSGLILFLTAPIIPIFMVLIANISATLTQKQWKSLSRMSSYFLDILQGLATLKILGQSKDQAKRVAQVSNRFREITMNVMRVTFLSALVMELTATLSTAIIAVEIGLRLLYGKLAFEQAFFVLILVPEFYLPLRLLGLRFHAGMAGAAAARQIFDVLDTSSPAKIYPVIDTDKSLSPGNRDSITFQNVSFAYIENQPILENISFEVKPGQKIALVGPSGAGKSTITSLLLRFYSPDQGCIFYNGNRLQDIPIEAWLRNVAWVPQRPYLFSDTIAANIRLTRPDASIEEIKAAARLANADEFIQEMDEGYDTQIGERGVRLSGGQAQRIALARAFLKDAPLLILDEPTSNLDPELEAMLQDSLDQLMSGRMVLVIAHRLSTVYQADRVLVISQGKIVESGNHQTLIQARGFYWKMVTGEKIDVGNEKIGFVEAQNTQVEGDQPDQRRAPMDLPVDLTTLRVWGKNLTTKTLFQLISLLAPLKGWVVLSILLGFLTIASGVGLLSDSTYIISAAALQPSIAELQVAIVGVRFFGISRALFRYLERIVSHQVTFNLLTQLRVWFYKALEPLVPARLMEVHSGDLFSRIVSDIAALENFYVRGAAPSCVALLILLGIALFMLQYNPWLSLVIVIFQILGGVALPLWIWKAGKEPGGKTIQLHSLLSTILVDSVQGLPDLTAFTRLKQRLHEVQAENIAYSVAQRRSSFLNSLQNALAISNANLALWFVLVLGAWLVQQKQMNPVLLGVICMAALNSFEAVHVLPQTALHLGKDLQAAQRLMAVVQVEPEQPRTPQWLPAPDIFSLDIEQVSFAYPVGSVLQSASTQRKDSFATRTFPPSRVLSEITFSIRPGEHVAIVGPSGAGKSSIANLLLRFWDYQAGHILLGGKEIRQYDPDDLRRWFNILPQSTHLFSGTIQENLRLANPQASIAEIEQAVKKACLSELIENLPQRYQTWIGEQGVRLSAGERQRLALARAFLRDSPVMVLDEGTANLDPLLEQKILAEIKRFCQHRTRLTITHRLVGLEDANEILVMQHGVIVERGPHARLLELNGIYRKMWDLQNQALVIE